jgi:Acetyltransferase (GNAT) family
VDGHAASGLLNPRVGVATDADDAALRDLLRSSPMDGAIRVTFEREPSLRAAAAAEGDPYATVVARTHGGRAVGMGSRAVMDVYVDGAPARVGYLGQLRVDPAWRGRRAMMRSGYAAMRALRGTGEAPFDLTAVVKDNIPARRLLEAGLPGLPAYRPLQELVTCVLSTWPRPRAPRGPRVARGDSDRIAAIVACLDRNARRHQLARRWTAEVLQSAVCSPGLSPCDFFLALSHDQIVGCLALWDQRSFKQVVVRGYSPALARWRTVLNAGARLVGAAPLPPAGHPLAHAYVSHVAVDGDEPRVFAALLAAARREARARGLAYVVTGFAAGHPLLPVAARGARRYESVLYTVHWDGGTPSFDGRLAHPEVALL